MLTIITSISVFILYLILLLWLRKILRFTAAQIILLVTCGITTVITITNTIRVNDIISTTVMLNRKLTLAYVPNQDIIRTYETTLSNQTTTYYWILAAVGAIVTMLVITTGIFNISVARVILKKDAEEITKKEMIAIKNDNEHKMLMLKNYSKHHNHSSTAVLFLSRGNSVAGLCFYLKSLECILATEYEDEIADAVQNVLISSRKVIANLDYMDSNNLFNYDKSIKILSRNRNIHIKWTSEIVTNLQTIKPLIVTS
jgi:hypothetical protein